MNDIRVEHHVRPIRLETILLAPLLFALLLLACFAVQSAHAQDRMTATIIFQNDSAHPGDTVGVAIAMKIVPNWHIYPGKGSPDEQSGYIPTEIEVNLPDGWTAGQIQWPPAHDMLFGPPGFQEEIRSYEGLAIAFIPVTVPPDQSEESDVTVSAEIKYQACDDSICEMPTKAVASAELQIIPADQPIKESTDPDHLKTFAKYTSVATPSSQPDTQARPQRLDLSLHPERPVLIPGDQIGIAVVMDIHKTWHLQPGAGSNDDADFPTQLNFNLPDGWAVGPIQWPPSVKVPAPGGGPSGEDIIDAYEGRAVALVGLTLPSDVKPGTYPLSASVEYQACDPKVCEPPATIDASVDIKVVADANALPVITPGNTTTDLFRSFDRAAAFKTAIDIKSSSSEQPTQPEVNWFTWPRLRWYGVGAIITAAMLFMLVQTLRITSRIGIIFATLLVAVVITGTAWSFIASAVAEPEGWLPYSHNAFNEARERGGLIVVDFTAEWCLNCKTVEKMVLRTDDFTEFIKMPGVYAFIADITTGREEAMEFKNNTPEFGGGIPILAIYQPNEPRPVIFQGLYSLGPVMNALRGRAEHIESGHIFDFFGWRFSIGKNGWPIVLLLAALAGFFLNLTPCVLPVIPIKIISLQAHAKNPARCFFLGITFGLGIVAMFAVLGLLMGGLILGLDKMQWGEFFQYWWANLILGSIILVMAFGMFGAFTAKLPDWVYLFNPQSDSAKGSFFLGVLTAVLATPCAGPLLGAALTWAATQPAWLAMAMFIVMGIGMALPYVILTANPKWIDRMPKSGPGSELVKQVMGILLLAAAFFFLGSIPLNLQNTPSSPAAGIQSVETPQPDSPG